jgi:biotin operon repressor
MMNEAEYRFESSISGFVIAPNEIINECGGTAALVYGKVWLYAQQRKKVCFASIAKIASELRMSERTVIRHLKTLKDGGYLIDLTPNLRYKPHTYQISGKVKLMQKTELVVDNTDNHPSSDKESASHVTKSHIVSDNLSVKDISNIELKNKTQNANYVCDGGNSLEGKESLSTVIREALKDKEQNSRVFLGFLGKEYRELGRAFLEHAGADYSPNSDGDKRLWVKELKTWRAIGVSTNDIKSVVDDMRKRGLSIKSPVSITGMLRDYKAKQSKERDKVFAGNEQDLY